MEIKAKFGVHSSKKIKNIWKFKIEIVEQKFDLYKIHKCVSV